MSGESRIRHPAYGEPAAPLYSPPVQVAPPPPVDRCGACGALWQPAHEWSCPHGGTPPRAELAAPSPFGPPNASPEGPQIQGDTCFEAAALEEARKADKRATAAQGRRGLSHEHTVKREGRAGGPFQIVSRPLTPTEMPEEPKR